MQLILRLLGLDEIAKEYSGSVKTLDLAHRLASVTPDEVVKSVRPDYHSDMEKFRNADQDPDQERKGATMISQGLSQSDIATRLKAIKRLVTFAQKHGYDEIGIG